MTPPKKLTSPEEWDDRQAEPCGCGNEGWMRCDCSTCTAEDFAAAQAEARAYERERCAQACHEMDNDSGPDDCRDAIRALAAENERQAGLIDRLRSEKELYWSHLKAHGIGREGVVREPTPPAAAVCRCGHSMDSHNLQAAGRADACRDCERCSYYEPQPTRHKIGRRYCDGKGFVRTIGSDGEEEWDTCDECYEQPRCACGKVASKTWAGSPVCSACISAAWGMK